MSADVILYEYEQREHLLILGFPKTLLNAHDLLIGEESVYWIRYRPGEGD